tara:strand:- start:1020 stop:3905 length:2886 start_codon:yes stop_codon:yes gene_type:complete
MNFLRKNQQIAVECSKNNNFSSGVHFHATGTGKSWIALELILEYNKKYENRNILWLCEQKSILIEQFHKSTLKEKGYDIVLKKFLVIDYTENKPNDWYQKVNSATFWKKPILLIINRQFLVSQKKYEKIKMNIDLIIHDECHSIQNNTTQEFYDLVLSKNSNLSCLGFSATPCLEYPPYNTILSQYTIYDAYCDNIIVPPKIKWVESGHTLNDNDFLEICKKNMKELVYKKIIVWCGIIEKCNELALLWKKEFKYFDVFTDTSVNSNEEFNLYAEKETNAILFCACKHREGSDIKNLDGCIFLDKVENRTPKTFVQCIGRVLRKDKLNQKKYGLILDLKASSCIKICDRMNEYLSANVNFPWTYQYNEIRINNKPILEHELLLKEKPLVLKKLKQSNIQNIVDKFVKNCPMEKVYLQRLNYELNMIKEKNLESYLIRSVEILEMTNFIPHVTRGSCGSSLVCYLLGISNVDPVEHNISFARFLNEYRSNLPDIDFDFPHYLRDEVFLQLELEWPNQVARISNHVHWHEKSALREGLRLVGINKQIPKEELHEFISGLSKEKQKQIFKHKSELENTFRHYSLHCGGIVFFHEGVPEELQLNKKTLSQIIYDKRDVANTKNFKIDILSSRGISQLIGIVGRNINFNDCPYDEKTYQLLQSGDNIGITLAESPLMRKALLMLKPKTINDLAICLAIIRPAAKDTRKEVNDIDYGTKFIFDDDAITLLMNYLGITEGLADKFRRNISKNSWNEDEEQEYKSLLSKLDKAKKIELEEQLKNLRLYSFCKSHSYSYAQLVYKLAYQKAHYPRAFWDSTIKNVSSSYRKWVHLYEACINGVNVQRIINKETDCSIYAEARKKKFDNLTYHEQMKRYGYWNMKNGMFFPNCYFYKKDDEYLFSGLIASMRVLNNKPKLYVCYIGVAPHKYIELTIKNRYIKPNHFGIKGRAMLKNEVEQTYEAHIANFY